MACERAGLPMDAIAAAIRAGRLSFAFLEAAPYHRWAVRPTYRQVSEETGVPLDVLRELLEAMGFAWTSPDDPMREDELEVVPVARSASPPGSSTGRGWPGPAGPTPRACAWPPGSRPSSSGPASSSRCWPPLGQRQAMELASELAAPFMPLVDRALMGIYRRQQELIWTEHQVENIEVALEEAGALARPERMPAMCFLDLAGYTRLTEERGDQAAAELAETLALLVERSSRAHGGTPVKWLGDGVMLHFREPAGAVSAALAMVGQVPEAGLPRPTSAWPPGRWSSRAATTRPHRQPGLPGRRPRPGRAGPGHRAGGRGRGRRRRPLHRAGRPRAQGLLGPVRVLEASRADGSAADRLEVRVGVDRAAARVDLEVDVGAV